MFDVYFPEINCSELLQTLPDIMPLYSRNNVLLLRAPYWGQLPQHSDIKCNKTTFKTSKLTFNPTV